MSSFFSDQGGGAGAVTLKLQPGAGFSGVIESLMEVPEKEYRKEGNGPIRKHPVTGLDVTQLAIVLKGAPDNYATASKRSTDPETGAEVPDDGRRTLYVSKGKNLRGSNLSIEIGRKLTELGKLDVGLEVGGQFAVQYTHDIPTNEGNPAKGHAVWYTPPAPASGTFFAGQQSQPAPQQAPAPAAAPSAQQYQQPAPQAAPQQQFAPQAPPVQQQAPVPPQYQQPAPQAAPQQQFAAPAPQAPPPGFPQQAPGQYAQDPPF